MIITLLCVSMAGCSRQTRHEVLTFFFTGVPPIEETKENLTAELSAEKRQEQSGVPRDKQAPETADKLKKIPNIKASPKLYSHPVWANGECTSCHAGDSKFGFAPIGSSAKPNAVKVFYNGGGMPGKLLLPVEKICQKCHVDKGALRAITDGLWLHHPVATGNCISCHDAHQSKYPHVLKASADQLCGTCHTLDGLAIVPEHQTNKEGCLACHNPHLGKNRHLLKSDYLEIGSQVRTAVQGSDVLRP